MGNFSLDEQIYFASGQISSLLYIEELMVHCNSR